MTDINMLIPRKKAMLWICLPCTFINCQYYKVVEFRW